MENFIFCALLWAMVMMMMNCFSEMIALSNGHDDDELFFRNDWLEKGLKSVLKAGTNVKNSHHPKSPTRFVSALKLRRTSVQALLNETVYSSDYCKTTTSIWTCHYPQYLSVLKIFKQPFRTVCIMFFYVLHFNSHQNSISWFLQRKLLIKRRAFMEL